MSIQEYTDLEFAIEYCRRSNCILVKNEEGYFDIIFGSSAREISMEERNGLRYWRGYQNIGEYDPFEYARPYWCGGSKEMHELNWETHCITMYGIVEITPKNKQRLADVPLVENVENNKENY